MKHAGRFKLVKRKTSSQNRRPFAEKKITLWDQASRWYDSLVGGQGTDYQKDIIMPGVFQLLEIKKKDCVLDLACGQGVFSRYLSKRGVQVEGRRFGFLG